MCEEQLLHEAADEAREPVPCEANTLKTFSVFGEPHIWQRTAAPSDELLTSTSKISLQPVHLYSYIGIGLSDCYSPFGKKRTLTLARSAPPAITSPALTLAPLTTRGSKRPE